MKISFILYFLIATISLTLTTSCEKDNLVNDGPPGLEGKWVWEKSVGGFAGITIKPNPGDCDQYITFTYTQFTETGCTSIIRQHPYELETNADVFGSDTLLVLDGAANYGMRINADTLLLSEQLFDGFTHFYVR